MRSLFLKITLAVALLTRATVSYSQPAYIELGVALGYSLFKDNATSPLFYKGNTLSITGAWLLQKNTNEKLASINYTFGKHSNSYNNTNNSARFYNLEFSYLQLYLINKLSSKKLKVKIGAGVVSTLNIRENKALMNNSLGIESISNILFSTKLSRPIFKLKHKKSTLVDELSLILNVGIINMNYRPGYAYNYMPSIKDSYVKNMTDYHFSLNGFRLNSTIQYFKQLQNKNILGFSYNFSAYNAPGKYEPFSYARHCIKLSFLLNYK